MLAADEVYALHTGTGAEAEFFQGLAKQGYAGGKPGVSQQGVYCFTPGGMLLASDNTRDPQRMIRCMDAALSKWNQLPPSQRLGVQALPEVPAGRLRGESFYPKNGLVLRMYSRDLGPSKRILGDFENAWNSDMVWFRAEEVRQLVPPVMRPGVKADWPAHLARRLARLHLVDNVLGMAIPFQERAVTQAALHTEVTRVEGSHVHLNVSGQTAAGDGARSVQTQIMGNATFDRKLERFIAFDMIAIGTRQGATKAPYIRNDTGAGPIGFAFVLASDASVDRIAPAFFPAYGWR